MEEDSQLRRTRSRRKQAEELTRLGPSHGDLTRIPRGTIDSPPIIPRMAPILLPANKELSLKFLSFSYRHDSFASGEQSVLLVGTTTETTSFISHNKQHNNNNTTTNNNDNINKYSVYSVCAHYYKNYDKTNKHCSSSTIQTFLKTTPPVELPKDTTH